MKPRSFRARLSHNQGVRVNVGEHGSYQVELLVSDGVLATSREHDCPDTLSAIGTHAARKGRRERTGTYIGELRFVPGIFDSYLMLGGRHVIMDDVDCAVLGETFGEAAARVNIALTRRRDAK